MHVLSLRNKTPRRGELFLTVIKRRRHPWHQNAREQVRCNRGGRETRVAIQYQVHFPVLMPCLHRYTLGDTVFSAEIKKETFTPLTPNVNTTRCVDGGDRKEALRLSKRQITRRHPPSHLS